MLNKATLLMRAIVLCIGAAALLFAVILFPELSKTAAFIAREASVQISAWFTYVNIVFLVGLYVAAMPFLFALYQTMMLLHHIDKGQSFSVFSEKAVNSIKHCAIAFFALYIAGVMPIAYCFAALDDAPGVVIMGLAVGLFPLAIAAFSAVFQKLIREGVDMKLGNNLT